jgi:glycosyltransferase involved in cell wall biosynthesis
LAELESLPEGQRQLIRERIHERVRQRYDWDLIARQYFDLLNA